MDFIIYPIIFVVGFALGIVAQIHAMKKSVASHDRVMRESRDHWRDQYQDARDSLARIKARIGEASRRVRTALDEYEVELSDNEVYPQPDKGDWHEQ